MKFTDKIIVMRENNKILQYISFGIKKLRYLKPLIDLRTEENKRKNGKSDRRYVELRKLRNKHLGERCFIVATGPSLTIDDLELIKSDVCFGMNSICKVLDKTKWRPTYFGIQDSLVYDKLESRINELSCPVIVGSNIADDFVIKDTFIQFPLDHLYHQAEIDIDKYFAKFSDDAYTVVYDGYSITYSLLQIAVYMGFSEIYLLGCDCNYPKGQKNHFVESGFVDKYAYKNHDKMVTGYQAAKEYADDHGISIVNCTRGGMLEVFPRKKLEDVLKMEVKK